MKNISKQNLINELKTRKEQCIGEIEAISNLITLYEDIDLNIRKLKYQKIRWEKLGMNQKEFAKKVGLGITTISNFENGIGIRQENYDKILNMLKL